MRLARLALKNWKNFHRADFPLRHRMVVVGPNAVGKSNLLDALRFLAQIATPGGGFQKAVRDRGGRAGIRCLSAPDRDREVTVRAGLEREDGRLASYELTLGVEPRGQRRPIVKRETVVVDGRERLSRPTAEDEADPERLTQTHLEQTCANREFREMARFFASIQYLDVVPQLIRASAGTGHWADDPYGENLVLRIVRTPERIRARRLGRIVEALRRTVPQFDDLGLTADEIGQWHLSARHAHWRPKDARRTESEFSDGTLRLIALLWSLLERNESSGLLLLEKPERTLHPEIVRLFPTILSRVQFSSGSQVILTTHSSEILEDEGLGVNEVLVLRPGPHGTEAQLGSDFPDIQIELDAGLSLADIVIPETSPPAADRLPQVFARR